MGIKCGVLNPGETLINILGGYLCKENQEEQGIDAEEAKREGERIAKALAKALDILSSKDWRAVIGLDEDEYLGLGWFSIGGENEDYEESDFERMFREMRQERHVREIDEKRQNRKKGKGKRALGRKR